MQLSPEGEKQQGLTRDRLVAAALELINEDGLDALSMRSLANRLQAKAASLYWHVRDRREPVRITAESTLGSSPPRGRGAPGRQRGFAGGRWLPPPVSA